MTDHPRRTLALAIPAYNEADGIWEFLGELDDVLVPWDGPVAVHVVDDASTDDTLDRLEKLGSELSASLHVARNETNKGHGPTTMRAYRLALASGADVIVQVDGDGQFNGDDLWSLLKALDRGADVVEGVRQNRTDPWFRTVLSRILRMHLRVVFGATSQDPNCPFRAYRRESLERLIDALPAEAMVPTVYLTVLARRAGLRVDEVPVRHRVRRGASAQGSTWGRRQRRVLVPRRLVVFVWQALGESVRFAREVRFFGT